MRTSILGGFALVAASVGMACSGSAGSSGFGSSSSGGGSGSSSGGREMGAAAARSPSATPEGGRAAAEACVRTRRTTTSLAITATTTATARSTTRRPATGACPCPAPHTTLPTPSASARTRTRRTGASSPPRSRTASQRATPTPVSTPSCAEFGSVITPSEGQRLGVLSSGYAFQCDDANPSSTCANSGQGDPYFKGEQQGMTGPGTAPPGYPKAAARLHEREGHLRRDRRQRADQGPANAQGLQFDFDFYSGEWPEYVCTTSTTPSSRGSVHRVCRHERRPQHLLRREGNPVSVNNDFFDALHDRARPPAAPAGRSARPRRTAGPTELQGTGFYNLGSCCGGQPVDGRRRHGLADDEGPGQAERDHHGPVHHLGHGRPELGLQRARRRVRLEPGPTQTGTGVAQ